MSDEESHLTKSVENNDNEDGASPELEESEKHEEQDGDENEEEQQSAPNTPSSVNPPSQHSHMTPQSIIPIQPYYPPYPYPYYPGMPMAGQAPSNSTMYTDASAMMDPPPDSRRNRGGVTEPFPEKLHKMLDFCEHEGLADVASFFAHGRAFAIHKPRRFQDHVMPKFFRQTRLTSFQRQLNLCKCILERVSALGVLLSVNAIVCRSNATVLSTRLTLFHSSHLC